MHRHAFLPLVTYPDADAEAVAANAVRMAACLDAELHALALNPDIPDVSSPVARFLIDLPDLIGKAEETSRARGERLLRKVTDEGRKAGVEVVGDSVKYGASFLPETAATRARYYDYAFCGWEASSPTAQTVAEAVIFGSGRPTMLLPELCPVGSLLHVAIAWDGSRVAARAAGDAGQLLRRAEKITVLTVLDEKPLHDKQAGARLAAGLAARGLPATAASINAEDCPIATTLQERALELGAGILVMGAFGHSRVRDFVLGGATRGVLNDVRMPVMLSH
jgi:nucleotide-binding universal stress UspA family protein